MPKSNKTRKNRLSSSSSSVDFHEGECCEATFQGLNCWYKHLFEKLGWMILAKSRGMEDKLTMYKTSLSRFKHAIEHKLSHTKDHDRKHDLNVMHHNIKILIEHAEKDFA